MATVLRTTNTPCKKFRSTWCYGDFYRQISPHISHHIVKVRVESNFICHKRSSHLQPMFSKNLGCWYDWGEAASWSLTFWHIQAKVVRYLDNFFCRSVLFWYIHYPFLGKIKSRPLDKHLSCVRLIELQQKWYTFKANYV